MTNILEKIIAEKNNSIKKYKDIYSIKDMKNNLT